MQYNSLGNGFNFITGHTLKCSSITLLYFIDNQTITMFVSYVFIFRNLTIETTFLTNLGPFYCWFRIPFYITDDSSITVYISRNLHLWCDNARSIFCLSVHTNIHIVCLSPYLISSFTGIVASVR